MTLADCHFVAVPCVTPPRFQVIKFHCQQSKPFSIKVKPYFPLDKTLEFHILIISHGTPDTDRPYVTLSLKLKGWAGVP
jgi:hypothetical protein